MAPGCSDAIRQKPGGATTVPVDTTGPAGSSGALAGFVAGLCGKLNIRTTRAPG
ncbi:MAG: hypothetical protein LUP97_00970 [Methanoregula sp.]|nr:hypothetical protein [Methanoregula sp.]